MKLKNLISLLFILCVITVFSQQKSFEIPTLDKGKVFNAKLTPDSENKEVLSAYLKGKTTKDTLRIKVKGTSMVQNVTITVLCLDKIENLNIEIAKGNWKEVKRKGKTKNGFYQVSFKTARNFGVSIHNNKTGTPFNIIIWTSGELKPKSNNLFIPISEYNKKNNTSFNDPNKINDSNEENSNFTRYLIAGSLLVIIILLFMLIKKKNNKSLSLFVLLFTLSNFTFSQISQEDVNEIKANLSYFPAAANAIRIGEFFNEGKDGQSDFDRLSSDDRDYEPNVNPDGQPELPSSCMNAGNKNRPKADNKDNSRNNRRNTDRTSTEDDDTKYDDLDRPKYDEEGNAIDYGENNSNTNSSNSNTQVMDDYQTNTQGDGLKKDKDGNPIPGSAPIGQVMDDEVVVIHNIELPKYDKDGKPIEYDISNRPKHDVDGVPINYATENDQTDYNREGRPKYDKDGKPIIYDNLEKPTYDKNGSIIKYKGEPERLEGDPEKLDEPENVSNNTQGKGNVRESETAYNDKDDSNNENNIDTNRNQTADNKVESTGNKTSGNKLDDSEGCECLEKAYGELEDIRYKFEKLRIIYTNTESFTKKQISFGDDVSPLTGGIGGLAWQKQRVKILKSMETFYKAYDRKYLQFVGDLKVNLKEIEECEAKLDFENWYSSVGFLYFNFIKDKYKRN